MTYNPEILPLAGGILVAAIICIVLRSRFAKGSNGAYKGAGVDRLVFPEKKLEKGMIAAGVVLILVAVGVAVSGFFIE